jgi:hypothetical protein
LAKIAFGNFRGIGASASLGGRLRAPGKKRGFCRRADLPRQFSRNQRLSFVGWPAKSVVFAGVPTPPRNSGSSVDESRK